MRNLALMDGSPDQIELMRLAVALLRFVMMPIYEQPADIRRRFGTRVDRGVMNPTGQWIWST
jgi:hypothetical protein